MDEEINYGKEFSGLRRTLKISQKDFSKMSSIPIQEIKDFEDGSQQNLLYKRIKISLTLAKILSVYYQELPKLLVVEISRVIDILNPFDKIEDFYDLFRSMNNFRINTNKFLSENEIEQNKNEIEQNKNEIEQNKNEIEQNSERKK